MIGGLVPSTGARICGDKAQKVLDYFITETELFYTLG